LQWCRTILHGSHNKKFERPPTGRVEVWRRHRGMRLISSRSQSSMRMCAHRSRHWSSIQVAHLANRLSRRSSGSSRHLLDTYLQHGPGNVRCAAPWNCGFQRTLAHRRFRPAPGLSTFHLPPCVRTRGRMWRVCQLDQRMQPERRARRPPVLSPPWALRPSRLTPLLKTRPASEWPSLDKLAPDSRALDSNPTTTAG
jgi:hypothetical protein